MKFNPEMREAMKNPGKLVTILAALRLFVGASAYLTPRLNDEAVGAPAIGTPGQPVSTRFFGARDIAYGIGLLTASDSDRNLWVRLGMATDFADAAALYVSGVPGKKIAPMAVALGVGALGAAVLAQRTRTN
ncbi:hypothetical protein [Rhodococcus olei]|uniref:hypothetical protein n=1 Tax=Rhodococcus olei TaxID=2161675 RepID=UPI0031ED5A3E